MEIKAGIIPESLANGPALRLTRFPAPHKWAARGEQGELKWEEVLKIVVQPELWPGSGTVQVASDRLPAWTFARFRDDSRVVTRDEALSARETRARLLDVHGLVLEYIDEPAADGEHIEQWWSQNAFIGYTTSFHNEPFEGRPPGPRWRVLLPFAHPVTPAVAAQVAQWARHPRHAAGIIDAVTEDTWRVAPVPAIAPGGFRWVASNADLLDPEAAIAQLTEWQEMDVLARANRVLTGTEFRTAAARLIHRRQTPSVRPEFPVPALPQLQAVLGDLWPGRVVGLLGTGGSGRTALAFQFACAAAEDGLPVMLVLTRMGTDEAVARLVAPTAHRTARELLAGQGDTTDAAITALTEQCGSLHLWAPPADDRTVPDLMEKLRALSETHGGVPPLVVVDGVEGWSVTEPVKGARSLTSSLRDASHAGTLSDDWPGAAVLFVGSLAGPPLTPSRLAEKWNNGGIDLGPLEPDAAAVALVAVRGTHGCVVVAKNRDGGTGMVPLGFDTVTGTFIPDAGVSSEA